MSKFLATAAASSGVPSEKVTPGRILKVYSVASAFTVQLSAIQGSISSVLRILVGQLVGDLVQHAAVGIEAARRRIEIGVRLLLQVDQRSPLVTGAAGPCAIATPAESCAAASKAATPAADLKNLDTPVPFTIDHPSTSRRTDMQNPGRAPPRELGMMLREIRDGILGRSSRRGQRQRFPRWPARLENSSSHRSECDRLLPPATASGEFGAIIQWLEAHDRIWGISDISGRPLSEWSPAGKIRSPRDTAPPRWRRSAHNRHAEVSSKIETIRYALFIFSQVLPMAPARSCEDGPTAGLGRARHASCWQHSDAYGGPGS